MAAEALAIEAEDARAAGSLGFMARILVQVGLPHSEPKDGAFLRRNGDLSFCITAHPDVGLPYGRYPRLLLIWMTGEAVRTKSPLLHLGPTLSGSMAGARPDPRRRPLGHDRPPARPDEAPPLLHDRLHIRRNGFR